MIEMERYITFIVEYKSKTHLDKFKYITKHFNGNSIVDFVKREIIVAKIKTINSSSLIAKFDY